MAGYDKAKHLLERIDKYCGEIMRLEGYDVSEVDV